MGCFCTYFDSVLLCTSFSQCAFTYIYSDVFGGHSENEPMPTEGPGHTWEKLNKCKVLFIRT